MNYKKILIYPLGFAVALIVGAFILLMIGIDPILAYQAIFSGSFGSAYGISETLVKAAPLLLTAFAFSIPYWTGFWNIGAEGQLFMGALVAVWLALSIGDLPIAIPLILIGSFLAGVVWMALPIILKSKLGVNEIFLTVVLNFIAILFISFLTTGPMKEPGNPNPQTATIPITSFLPRLIPQLRIHAGVFFPFLFVVFIYILLVKTNLGYKMKAVGFSQKAACYAGINISRTMAIAAFLGAGIAGIAGAGEVLGIHHFMTARFPLGLGYTGVLIAVLGKFNPLWEVPASIFFAVLLVGGETMQRSAGVPYGMIFMLIALITLFILGIEKTIERRK